MWKKVPLAMLALLLAYVIVTDLTRKEKPPKYMDLSRKTRQFSDGVWIRKYPGNYASFKFETPDGRIAITDPYTVDEKIAPDLVTESHQHLDHINVALFEGRYVLADSPGDYQVKNIKVSGFPGKHDRSDTDTTNIMFLFEIDGIRLAHLGSQGAIPERGIFDKLHGTDILLLQSMNDPAKLSPPECCEIIKRISPKIVIPEHGAAQAGLAIAKLLGLEQEAIPGGDFVITRRELASMKTMRILNLDTPE